MGIGHLRSLDGPWDFALGEEAPWGTIQVPGCWEAQGYSKWIDGPARYRRQVLIPNEWAGQQLLLEFDAVSYACTVRLNDLEVGQHRGLWTPFALDVTHAVHFGRLNTLELEVYKPGERYPMRRCLAGFLPDVATTFGGIWQPARLRAITASLDDLHVTADPDTGELRVRCQVSAEELHDATLEIGVLRDGQTVADSTMLLGPFKSKSISTSRRSPPEPAPSTGSGQALSLSKGDSIVEDPRQVAATLTVPDPLLWSPEYPALYQVCLQLRQNDQLLARASQRVGFRRLAADGERLLLNPQGASSQRACPFDSPSASLRMQLRAGSEPVEGPSMSGSGHPICLRGALSWGWDPDRIAPVYTAEQARDEMRRLRALGFNLVKLCLFVPNQTYFDVADEEGMLLWQEWPMWLPEVTDDLRATAPAEYAEYMRLTRHHPSVVLYSLGCELSQGVDEALLRQLDEVARRAIHPEGAERKATDGSYAAQNVLFCDNSGSGEAYEGLAVDFSDFSDYHPYCDLNYLEPLLDHWRRDWKRPRPLIFGEFCDSDGFRDLDEIVTANNNRKPWWMTEEIPIHEVRFATWRPEVRALLEEGERLKLANLGFTPQELVAIANAQSLVVRKYTLETIRRRAEVQGYVITGLRDTPLATSGIFDDLGRARWTPEAFRPFNDDTILCLDVGRRRKWLHGGDRPEPPDPYNWPTGGRVCLYVIANHTRKPVPPGSTLSWQVTGQDDRPMAEGMERIGNAVQPGRPCEIGTIEFTLPEAERAEALQLKIRWDGSDVASCNRWLLWSYPRPASWPAGLAIYDPACCLENLAGLLPVEDPRQGSKRKADTLAGRTEATVVISAALDAEVCNFLRDGGKVLLLQQGDGPLPARHGPFWREAIKLFPPHPIWDLFPHHGFADLQFLGLATDLMLDGGRLAEALPGLEAVRPVMRRLDAREFYVREYIVEAQVGRGRLLACTLRLQGGYGAQPGPQSNIAGRHLLSVMIDYLNPARVRASQISKCPN